MSLRRPVPRLAAPLLALVVLAACATPDDEPAEMEQVQEGGSDPLIDEEAAETIPDDGAERQETEAGVPLLDTASSEEYGDYLTDGDGRALYVSASDPPGESTCTDACLEQWPLVSMDEDRELGDDVDEDLVGSLERDDLPEEGFVQVTYRDKPLYYHVQDELPDQATGQGVDDNWFLIGPDGVELRG